MSTQDKNITLFGSKAKYWVYHAECSQTIIAIHGYRGTHHGLLDIIDRLPNFRILIPDLPGFGESTPMTERPNTIEGYADFMAALISSLKEPPAFILGHSMGTVVAAELAVRNQAMAKKLIMINPIAEHPLKGLGFFKMMPGIAYHNLGSILPDRAGEALLSNKILFLVGSATMTKTRDPQLRKKIHASHMTYMSHYHNRHTLIEAFRSSLNNTVTTRARAITVPTLLIAGAVDDIAPIKGQRKLVQILAQGKLVELANVGHIIHYEQPDAAARSIREFLA